MKINALLYWTGIGKSLTLQNTGYCLTAGEKRMREVELVTLWRYIWHLNEFIMGYIHTSIKFILDLFLIRWENVWQCASDFV